MFEGIRRLQGKGFYPDRILDIGAHHGNWTCEIKRLYPDCEYHLFEAIDYPELKRFDNDSRVKVHNIVLNDKVEDVTWYQKKNTGDSFFKEKTYHFADCEVITRKTIDMDTYITNNNILQNAKNIFIKIDCQGAEIPILKGATSILSVTDFIILEMPLFGSYNEGVPNFLEHVAFMDKIGFVPYDMFDNHYINGFNLQIDMIFINKNHEFNKTVNSLLMIQPHLQ
jgi:FkbM family methyltransferase